MNLQTISNKIRTFFEVLDVIYRECVIIQFTILIHFSLLQAFHVHLPDNRVFF